MSLVRKYGLVGYWLIWASYTAYVAQFPGLMLDRSQWTYPWPAVFVVWILLGVLVAILYFILRPMSYRRSWGRLAAACAYSAALLFLGISSVVTDAPGYYYVPAGFSMITMGGMVILVAITGGAAVVGKFRRAA